MANMKFVMEMPDKNFKVVAQYDGALEMDLDVTIGRRTTTLSQQEAMELYGWLGARLLQPETKTLELDKKVVKATASEVNEAPMAAEARRGIIDMSSRIQSPKKIVVNTSA